MPTLMQDGKDLVYFAAWKHTISLYPLPAVAGNFAAMVAPYRAAKSRVRFPLGKSLPYDLISRLVELLVSERESARHEPHAERDWDVATATGLRSLSPT